MIAALTAIHEYVSERNHSTCVELEGRRYTLQPCGVRKYDLAAKGAGPDGGRVYAPHTVQAPKANAIAERFVRTVRSECLDWLLILNRRHLEHMLRTFVYHYNSHRPHRSLDLAPPEPSDGNLRALRPPTASLDRRDRLGGLIHEYSLAA